MITHSIFRCKTFTFILSHFKLRFLVRLIVIIASGFVLLHGNICGTFYSFISKEERKTIGGVNNRLRGVAYDDHKGIMGGGVQGFRGATTTLV